MVSGLIEFSERGEQCLPYGQKDKVIGDQWEQRAILHGVRLLDFVFYRWAYTGKVFALR